MICDQILEKKTLLSRAKQYYFMLYDGVIYSKKKYFKNISCNLMYCIHVCKNCDFYNQ